ncbi:Ran GTPase-activating protein 1 [Sarcoptes scabiei]|uniref:Ran GTPase-activating protein 1 n=1 Tax=Sarcoptes scabiei TaxID=52283 RepID=A0A132A3U1_SARSC|nr:Ran GTPase-activating protein 1 [Sarcoptes scabiei]KPM05613.1 ran GTPase-activating protein 1-like protein [Sarcoptes scabiei]
MATSLIVKSSKVNSKFDSAEDVAEIIEQIKNNEDDVVTIQLEGNSYGIKPMKEIGSALQCCHNLKHLLLNNIFISRLKDEIPQALKFFFGGIQSSLAQIETLNLDDNAIGPVTMPVLLPFLLKDRFTNLKKLYLNNCGLGVKGGQMLAEILPCFTELNELVIGRNRLEIEGLKAISLALTNLSQLERLELPQNGSKDDAIIKLCLALQKNPNLRILNLNDNVLKMTSSEFCEALQKLKFLEILDLGDCLLQTKGAIEVLTALNLMFRENSVAHIKRIDLSGNEIDSSAKKTIIETLNCILENRQPNRSESLIVNLSGNNLGNDAIQDLRQHFGSSVDLVIEDDQGSDHGNDDDDDEENDTSDNPINLSNGSPINSSTSSTIDHNSVLNKIESESPNLTTLAQRFLLISTNGFDSFSKTLNIQASIEIDALIEFGLKHFLKTEDDFTLINLFLGVCGLIKLEDKSLSPNKDLDLSGPIIAFATISKKLPSIQKKCVKQFLELKLAENRYANIKMNVFSLLYRF